MKHKKGSRLITCPICKKRKVMPKHRVTCSRKCALKYSNSIIRYKNKSK